MLFDVLKVSQLLKNHICGRSESWGVKYGEKSKICMVTYLFTYVNNFWSKKDKDILRSDSESWDHVLFESLNHLSDSLN